ncbi:MAG: hypothetical protein K2N86_00160, partial [Rikenellaceae bacterium]|nr:hypothetical protein [Rikenellaceae bacterium]
AMHHRRFEPPNELILRDKLFNRQEAGLPFAILIRLHHFNINQSETNRPKSGRPYPTPSSFIRKTEQIILIKSGDFFVFPDANMANKKRKKNPFSVVFLHYFDCKIQPQQYH